MNAPSASRWPRHRWWWLLAAGALLAALALVVATRGGDGPEQAPNRAFGSVASPDDPALVWAVGDGGDGSDASRRLADRIATDRPARVLYLGDVYENGTRDEWRTRYAPVYGRLDAITAPTPGNHDWPNHDEGYDPYWRAVTGAPTPPWYSLRVGGWTLLSLNSEAPHDPGSPQLEWLRAELGRIAGTCVLAFWHRPLQSAGSNGDQEDVAPLWDALRGRAPLVVNGHDHTLQRLRPRAGMTQYVIGAGGKSHYDVDEGDPRLEFSDDERDGALRMRLRPGRARLEIVATDGAILDTTSMDCEPRG